MLGNLKHDFSVEHFNYKKKKKANHLKTQAYYHATNCLQRLNPAQVTVWIIPVL